MGVLLQLLPMLVFGFVIFSVIRNIAKVLKQGGRPTAVPRQPANFDPALEERTRRIQAEIRRKIAERRGLVVTPEAEPVVVRVEPPVMAAPEREVPVMVSTNAVLERQQQLAAQMRSLEAARTTELRRATQAGVALEAAAAAPSGLRLAARDSLLADLRDPSSLRRAFVLREVLDRPVGLR